MDKPMEIPGKWKAVEKDGNGVKISDKSEEGDRYPMNFPVVKAHLVSRSNGIEGDVDFFVDTGSDQSIISLKDKKELDIKEEMLEEKFDEKGLKDCYLEFEGQNFKSEEVKKSGKIRFNPSIPISVEHSYNLSTNKISLLGRDFLNLCFAIIMNYRKDDFALVVGDDVGSFEWINKD